MEKDKANLGDIRINKKTGKPEICMELVFGKEGIEVQWEDYDTILLKTTYGECGHTNDIYPLNRFKESFMPAQKEKAKIKNQIKIRYAYISSPTNMKEDPSYYESLRFKVLTIEELEQRSIRTTLEELITDGEEALMEVLGRDRCTGLKDMTGKEIYENDIIRWYPNKPKNHIDVSINYCDNRFTLGSWYEDDYPETEEYCKIIGNTYKNPLGGCEE